MFLGSDCSTRANILPQSLRGLFHGELTRKNVSPRVCFHETRGAKFEP